MTKLPNRSQGEQEGGYFWQDELVFGQCDAFLNLRMSSLLEHLVNSASQHCRCFGMSYETLLSDDVAFVLTRASLEIHKLPHCFQLLTLKTWIDGTKGPYYQRITQWFDQEGQVMVSGRSDWVLIQPSTRTLLKPDKNDARFQVKSPVSLPSCLRLRFSSENMEELGQHKVTWSEIDGNAHLHSAHYGDIIWDFLPENYRQKIPQAFHIEFQKEGCLGDEIAIFAQEIQENTYAFVGECQGNGCFKSQIQFFSAVE